MHLAEEDGRIVGGASAFEFQFTVPGAIVPAAGVTIVGVLPTHRRQGILTQLMRAQLDDIHERGEPVACLWASEETIYGRYGYGMAALCGEIDLQRVYGGFRKPVEHGGSFRLLTHEEALEAIPPVYARVAAETPGMFARPREWWEARALHDSEARRDGAGEMVRVVLERDGEGLAYALYRLKMDFDAGSSTGEVRVIEAMGVTPEATAAIWRFLLDVDWMDRVVAEILPIDHPLFLLLEHPRRLRFRAADSLWLRLVDVGAALAARSLEGAVVLEVADSFCSWNDARYTLDGAPTEGGCGSAAERLRPCQRLSRRLYVRPAPARRPRGGAERRCGFAGRRGLSDRYRPLVPGNLLTTGIPILRYHPPRCSPGWPLRAFFFSACSRLRQAPNSLNRWSACPTPSSSSSP
jgi:predicted acetyltransferase